MLPAGPFDVTLRAYPRSLALLYLSSQGPPDAPPPETITGNAVELVGTDPAVAASSPTGPHDLASVEICRVAEDTGVKTDIAAPLETVTTDRVHHRSLRGASVVGGDKGNVGIEPSTRSTILDPVVECA